MALFLATNCLLAVCLVLSLQTATIQADDECKVEWVRVLNTNNQGSEPLTETYKVTYGVTKTEESSSSKTDTDKIETGTEGSLEKKIAKISVSFTYSHTHSTTTTEMHGTQLSMTQERTLTIKVPPKTVMSVWQLQATYGGFRVGFEDTEVRHDNKKPEGKSTCDVTKKKRIKITDSTQVRLRHEATGQYLNTIKRKGWEAGTLGHRKNQLFRIVHNGPYVRLRLVHPMFSGYDVLYSSDQGGIYFDKYSDSHKQQWIISSSEVYDGDAVTFRNRNWQAAGLVKYDGPATNVYCISQHKLDKWVVEAA